MTRGLQPDPRADDWSADLAVDPDVDLHVDEQRTEWRGRRWTLPAASVGGMVGASTRYLVEQLLPHQPAGWPVATLLVNVSGCFLIGLLMALLTAAGSHRSLWRVFLGVGVLGGYTTFSTYAVQAGTLIESGKTLVAAAYLLVTILLACVAAFLGVTAGRTVVHRRTRAVR